MHGEVVPSMANGWSHAHGKNGAKVVLSTWQPTRRAVTTALIETDGEAWIGSFRSHWKATVRPLS
jgi:hypothetical protein